ncbi:MAG: radical SAM protein [Saprospiraceae bacterium]|nr:radical SAM protein [Saprospiraceae bacterium]
MKINTFTAVVGGRACNMNCPYCVSKMTGFDNVYEFETINWRNFHIACQFAQQNNVSTFLMTGKGEPTLYPELIDEYLCQVGQYQFPFKELQTNGILLDPANENNILEELEGVAGWYARGLTTICISIAHHTSIRNSKLLKANFPLGIWNTVRKLKEIGFSVRINCTLTKDNMDSVSDIITLMEKCKHNNVDQTTLRMVDRPDISQNDQVFHWVNEHRFDLSPIKEWLDKTSTPLLELPHGAIVYDWEGQNVCLSNCLTSTTNSENIRQLIFFPDGRLSYDWKYSGAVIL